jgi:hypothetical protein
LTQPSGPAHNAAQQLTLNQQASQDGQQLAMGFLETIERDLAAADSPAMSPEQALLISNAARQALADGSAEDPARTAQPWLDDYRELLEHGWPWRVACYIAWRSAPRRNSDGTERWPKTQGELAREVLGLESDRVIRTWRERNPGIEAAIAMVKAKALFEHRRDVFNALVTSASNPSHKNHTDRKLFLEMTGDYTPRQETITKNQAVPFAADEYNEAKAKLERLEQELSGGAGDANDG